MSLDTRSRPPAAGGTVLLRALLLLSACAASLCSAIATARVDAEPPWLSVEAHPTRVLVHESAHRSEAVVAFSLTNEHRKRVRVEEVRIVYLDNTSDELRTDAFDKDFFADPLLERPNKIQAGQTVRWRGICLVDPPAGTDRARFELDLVTRRGITRNRRRQYEEFELFPAPEPVRLRLPFEGYWKVTQGHGCSTNHRAGGLGGEFAWDFAALGGMTGQPAGNGRPDQEHTFGAPILSPSDGRVVRVVDGVPDNRGLTEYPRRSMVDDLRRPEWIFGNFIVIEIGDGAWVLLAHLEQDSIEVREGQEVTAGQIVGRGGNSGNSIEAHLHVQVMNGADPAEPETSGIPAVFVDYTEFTAVGGSTGRDLQARRIKAGDPPQQSVVAQTP